MIDSHCHPQFPQYDSDREKVIRRALDGGVQMVCVGTDLEKSQQAIELAEKREGIWATIGSHPNDPTDQLQISDFEKLLKHPKVVAVGEVGLDYYRTKEPGKQERQKEVFKQFLELAGEYNKPLIIHSRFAFADTYELLKAISYKLKAGAVIHSFTYTWLEARQFLALGLHIGLNGIITFTDQYNETVKNAPLECVLLETDAPFLAPAPHRGQRNEPLWVKAVAEQIAAIKNISVEAVAATTTANTKKLFSL